MPIQVGERAPEFELVDQHGQTIRSDAVRGEKATLLVFFPFAFSGVCTGELSGFRDRLGDFESDRVTLVTLSCDPVFTLRAFADRDGLFFPLLSDFWPHGQVASAFGVFDQEAGCASRSSYLIDAEGVVRWSVHSPMGTARDLDQHAEAISALHSPESGGNR